MAVSQGTVDKKLVSAIDFLDTREIDKNVYDVSRDRAFTDTMKLFGRYKVTEQAQYHNFVGNDTHEVGTVSAVTSTGLAQVVFTINTATGFPRKGDLIKSSNTNNNGKQARIQSISTASGTATLTVRSVGGNSSPWFVTVGDTISFGSNAYGEGSGAPDNRRYGMTKYYNKVQIFKEFDKITDIQKVSGIEVSFGGVTNILPFQTLKKHAKLQFDISVQMLAGTMSETSFSDANPWLTDSDGNAIQTTGGLDWYTTTYGISDSAATLGTFGFTELDTIIDNWIANKAPLDQMAICGSRAYRVVSKWAKNLGSSDITSGRMMLDGKTVDLEVETIKYGGATIDLVHLPILDHPELFSDTLSPEINGSLYFIPKDKIDTYENGQQPRIQIRHMPNPGIGNSANSSNNGIISELRAGALAGVPTSHTMVAETSWYTVQGLEAVGVKHFQRFRVV